MNSVTFNIKRWLFSSIDQDSNQFTLKSEHFPEKPAGKIPMGLKRRMTNLSKLAVQSALDITSDTKIDFVIFCGRHGELEPTVEILESISHREEVSPTAFSQSVHNTSSGIFTIAAKIQCPATSISASQRSFEAGCIEAYTYLAANPDHTVLLQYFDVDYAIPFEEADQDALSFKAAGLILSSGQSHNIQFTPLNKNKNETQVEEFIKQINSLNKTTITI